MLGLAVGRREPPRNAPARRLRENLQTARQGPSLSVRGSRRIGRPAKRDDRHIEGRRSQGGRAKARRAVRVLSRQPLAAATKRGSKVCAKVRSALANSSGSSVLSIDSIDWKPSSVMTPSGEYIDRAFSKAVV